MNPIGACSPGFSQAASAEANAYSSIFSANIYLFVSDWNLLLKPAVFIEGISLGMLMNVLWCRSQPAFCTANFIVLILFYYSTAAFMTRISLWFPWWLVSFGSLWWTCNPYDIKNYLTSGLNLLKNAVAVSNRNPTSCGSASILKRKQV